MEKAARAVALADCWAVVWAAEGLEVEAMSALVVVGRGVEVAATMAAGVALEMEVAVVKVDTATVARAVEVQLAWVEDRRAADAEATEVVGKVAVRGVVGALVMAVAA